MKEKKWLIIISLVILLFIGFITINRNPKRELVDKTNYIMGTVINLSMYDDIDDEIFNGAFDVVRDIEKKMSLQIKDSELNKLNNKGFEEFVELTDETRFVIEKGIDYSKLSNGYFDVSIGPIVKLWSIGNKDARVPKAEEIKDLLPKVNYKDISIEGNKVKLNNKGMIIDLGGIAKGYAADQVVKYLKSQGVDEAIIDLGGNIYTLGSKDEENSWTVGIQNPYNESRGDFLGTLDVSDRSVVTSGVYERYVEKDDKKYHHIIDPFTGYPVENELMSVSIISDESIDGDALSTAAFALGTKAGTKLVNSLKNVEAIFVTKDKEVYLTPKLQDNFKLKNDDFKVKKDNI